MTKLKIQNEHRLNVKVDVSLFEYSSQRGCIIILHLGRDALTIFKTTSETIFFYSYDSLNEISTLL